MKFFKQYVFDKHLVMYTDLVHLECVFQSGALDVLGKEVVCYCIKPWLEPPTNHLWELLKRNPDKEWNWYGYSLSQTSKITWEFVKNHPDKVWNWWELSRNPIITLEIVLNNPDRDRGPGKEWNWYELSMNPSMTWEDIQNNPSLPWNFSAMHCNNFNA